MKDLELFAIEFLRFEKRCPVALTERSPRPHHGRPDVLGITKDRYLLEIEVKRSLSDFRANADKPHIAIRGLLAAEHIAPLWPKQFWYLVPNELADKVEKELPEWAGLLRGPSSEEVQNIHCVKKAPVNRASERLKTRECVELAHCMANELYATWRRRAYAIEQRIYTLTFDHQSAGEYEI